MGKRPFRANYSQMVPTPSGAGWPGHLAFPEDGKPSKGWRRDLGARSLPRTLHCVTTVEDSHNKHP